MGHRLGRGTRQIRRSVARSGDLQAVSWEWLANEEFGAYLAQEPWRAIEPAWKIVEQQGDPAGLVNCQMSNLFRPTTRRYACSTGVREESGLFARGREHHPARPRRHARPRAITARRVSLPVPGVAGLQRQLPVSIPGSSARPPPGWVARRYRPSRATPVDSFPTTSIEEQHACDDHELVGRPAGFSGLFAPP